MSVNYEEEMRISSDLIKELKRQSQLYTRWALLATQYEIDYEDAKHDHDILRADYENRVRNFPEKYFIKKGVRVTDRVARYYAEAQEEVQKAYDKMNRLKELAKVYGKIERGFQQRKNMLEAIAFRTDNMYNSEPRERRLNRRNKG